MLTTLINSIIYRNMTTGRKLIDDGEGIVIKRGICSAECSVWIAE